MQRAFAGILQLPNRIGNIMSGDRRIFGAGVLVLHIDAETCSAQRFTSRSI